MTPVRLPDSAHTSTDAETPHAEESRRFDFAAGTLSADRTARFAPRVFVRFSHSRGLYAHAAIAPERSAVPPSKRMCGQGSAPTRDLSSPTWADTSGQRPMPERGPVSDRRHGRADSRAAHPGVRGKVRRGGSGSPGFLGSLTCSSPVIRSAARGSRSLRPCSADRAWAVARDHHHAGRALRPARAASRPGSRQRRGARGRRARSAPPPITW
jgi:hypothetical protein